MDERRPTHPRLDPTPDPVVEAYKADIDLSLLRANLKRSPTQRVRNLMALQRLADEARTALRRAVK